MLLLPLLPHGYASDVPMQPTCSTVHTTVTGAPEIVSTSTTTGAQGSTQTITVGTNTIITTNGTCVSPVLDTLSVTTSLNAFVVILITVPVVIAEYPFGIAMLILLMLTAYGLVKKRLTANEPQA